MITTVTTFLKRKILFIILLPVTWVLHGYLTNYGLVPQRDAILLALLYCGVGLFLTGIFWLLYKNIVKAALLSFFLLCLQFFFGPLHDFLKEYTPGTFFSKYSFLLPFILILIITASIYLARSKKNFYQVTFYLNTLLVILIITDSFSLALKSSKTPKINNEFNEKLNPCDTCVKPDIYLIVADGYPGNRQLNDLFSFDNSKFENALKKRGFFVVDSSVSNYNFTPFSIASMLNQEYLKDLEGSNSSKIDMDICFETIKRNKTFKFIQTYGYDIFNFSIFDLENQPSKINSTLIQEGNRLMNSQTLIYRIKYDLGYHLITNLKLGSEIKKVRELDLRNNLKLINLTLDVLKKKNNKSKFVYTHIIMPHYPYYFDSTGNKNDYKLLTEEFNNKKDFFISYLKYANKEYLSLIDQIMFNTNNQSIILFLSDHGFREFTIPVDLKYHFMTLNAVYIPDKNYTQYYKGQSNINTFRVLFNTVFNQKYSLLKDSSSFLAQ